MSDNDYYKRTKEFDPRTRANGLDVEFELDAISAAFDKIPAPREDGQGYDGPIHVGEATAPTHAVQLQQMEAKLGDNTENANRAEEAAERAEEARDIAIEKARQSGEARDEALEAAATVTNIHREQLEKALGVNARVFPRLTNQNLKVGDVIPAPEDTADGLPITHVIVDGNAYAMSSLVSGVVTSLTETSATIGGKNVKLSPKPPSTVERYGAAGDALISMSKPLYYLINGVEPLTRASATDDTQAIKDAIANESVIDFDGSKGYLVSDFITWSEANKRLVGNGAVIVYRGGRTPGLQGETPLGVFSPVGQASSTIIKAVPTSGIDVFSNKFTVNTATNTLSVGDWFLFKGDNGVTDFATSIRKYAYYPAQVNSVTDLGNGNTEIEMSYKTGFSFAQSEITIGEFVPCDNQQISGFRLIDEMPATPTPDILPVPQAPEQERREALGLVYAQNVTNFVFDDLQSYKAKYSTCTIFNASNGTVNNIRSFKPVWFGGGEGYAVRAISCCYLKTSTLSMLGGRHVIDWTTCGWCSHSGGNGETDQVSFSMHTQCEHDITISDTVGGDFYLANAAYGEVCTRITLKSCTFTKVRAKCLHITIDNCQLSDFELNANKATIKNTNIRDFHFADKEARSGADQIVSEYADAGKITVDEGCSIFRAKDYTAGTTIGGWYSAVISGRISSASDDTRFSVNYRDVARLKTDASYSETNLSISGVSREVDCRGAAGKITNPAINAAFVAISSLDVPVGETHVFDVRDMDLKLNGAMRPYQYVSRDDSVRAYNALVSIGGGKFRSCLQAQVTDVGAKLTVLGIARTSDAYDSGIETFVDSGNYAIKYEKGKVYNNSQTGNIPKWFDGTQFLSFV
ncbi:hypothetical protein O1C60_000102 [Vibrio cholerae]|nr:hypothetical protein [Vibrio cholerae]EKF9647573.1 hypothetical protein [Vibrio cholerae]EKF9648836.1 hypothetical protein [Vibrio cholerae]